MINLLWLVAIAGALVFQSAPGLLAIIAVFVLEAVIELKAIRRNGESRVSLSAWTSAARNRRRP